MSNNPNPTKAEAAYSAYWNDNEDYLLEEFLERNPNIGPVKEWSAYQHARFESYVQARFEAQGPEDEE